MKTLDTYRETLDRDATLVLTTDSEFFRLLKSIGPSPAGETPAEGAPIPAIIPPAILPIAPPVPAAESAP